MHSRVALITGGSRGIGNTIASTFASHGFDVAVVGKSSPMEEVCKSLPIVRENQRHLGYNLDVSNKESCSKMVRDLEKTLGPIEVLVNCAGISRDGLLVQIKEEDVKEIIETNLLGTIYMCSTVGKGMIQRHRGSR